MLYANAYVSNLKVRQREKTGLLIIRTEGSKLLKDLKIGTKKEQTHYGSFEKSNLRDVASTLSKIFKRSILWE